MLPCLNKSESKPIGIKGSTRSACFNLGRTSLNTFCPPQLRRLLAPIETSPRRK